MQSIAYGMGLTHNKLNRNNLLEDIHVKLEVSRYDNQAVVAKRAYQTCRGPSECDLYRHPKSKLQ